VSEVAQFVAVTTALVAFYCYGYWNGGRNNQPTPIPKKKAKP
jgi:hypothetical protein